MCRKERGMGRVACRAEAEAEAELKCVSTARIFRIPPLRSGAPSSGEPRRRREHVSSTSDASEAVQTRSKLLLLRCFRALFRRGLQHNIPPREERRREENRVVIVALTF